MGNKRGGGIMKIGKKDEIIKWYEKADADILIAKRALEWEPFILDPACFHCQQAIEKYLKAYLLYQGKDIEKTHNLTYLKELCAEYDSNFGGFNFEELNNFAIDIRYPDDAIAPLLSEAKKFLQLAEDVKGVVMSKITLD